MYYVITKKTDTYPTQFLGFAVPKFITKKNSDNVIFEFQIDGKVVRKWINKKEILLLTNERAFFTKTMKGFKEVQKEQEELLDEAKQKVDETVEKYAQTMKEEFSNFEEMKKSEDIPCLLKDL